MVYLFEKFLLYPQNIYYPYGFYSAFLFKLNLIKVYDSKNNLFFIPWKQPSVYLVMNWL